ncbi:MAG: hypothetical protein QXN71_01860 [Candidatus Aenigmatarchaeota archaeon]
MAKEIIYPPLLNWTSILKGVVGGGLVVSGIANQYGFLGALLVVIGIFVLMDGVMVTGRGVFIIECLISAIVSGAITLVLSATKIALFWVVLILVIAAFIYRKLIVKLAGEIRKKSQL